jgi:hypothetical protein
MLGRSISGVNDVQEKVEGRSSCLRKSATVALATTADGLPWTRGLMSEKERDREPAAPPAPPARPERPKTDTSTDWDEWMERHGDRPRPAPDVADEKGRVKPRS